LSKNAIAAVIETLRGTDFYRLAHEIGFAGQPPRAEAAR
jgi:replicative DNA helicase